jgi:ubiquinone/menaquinone biosynthesis C-methylase UbiE
MGRLYDATMGRLFSAVYDRGMKSSEEAGMRQRRHELLAQARGRVVELGAGTGLNLAHYPEGIESLTLVEPDPHMTKQLRPKLAGAGIDAEVVEAPAERLPFPDDSFETAVVTLVLCTVPDQSAVLAEIARVLEPGGQLLFLEHVRSRNPALAKLQDRLEGPWRVLGDGCHCNRDTAAAMIASPLEMDQIAHDSLPKAPPIVRPLIRGRALASK